MEILVLHPGALGDIILSLPALALLRESCPGAALTVAGNIDTLDTVLRGHADRRVSLSAIPLHRLYREGPLPDNDVRFWTSYDHIVSWTGAESSDFAARLKRLRPGAIVAPWQPGGGDHRHVSRIFVDSLIPLISAREELPPATIAVPPADLQEGEAWLQAHGKCAGGILLALHPGAGSATKRWPLDNFTNLARALARDANRTLLITEGPAEVGLGGSLAREVPATQALLAANLPLRLLAALLSRCDAFVGNDSGIAHLAAAVGIRSVVLFGPTSPQHWAPSGDHVSALRDSRGCPACDKRAAANHRCLENISTETVLSRLFL